MNKKVYSDKSWLNCTGSLDNSFITVKTDTHPILNSKYFSQSVYF